MEELEESRVITVKCIGREASVNEFIKRTRRTSTVLIESNHKPNHREDGIHTFLTVFLNGGESQ